MSGWGHLKFGVSTIALILAIPTLAFAQQSGAGLATDELTVTATKEAEPAIDSLSATSLIGRPEIERRQVQRLGEVLNDVPGVASQENPDDPATAINIRGLQDFGRVAVIVDGSRQNFQRSGHNANGAFFLDPAFVRVIDITRGPVANVYGSGAIGGVVAFRTVEPGDVLRAGERYAAEVTAGGNVVSQEGINGNAVGAFRFGNFAAGLIGVSGRSLNAYQDGRGITIPDSGQDLKSGIAKLEFTPADGHRILFGGMTQKYEFTNGIGTAQAPRRSNEVTTQNVFAKYRFSRPDTPWVNFSANIYDTSTDTDQVRISGAPAQVGQRRYFNITTKGVDLYNTSKIDLPVGMLNLTYGVDAFRDQVRTSDPFSSGDETTPGGNRMVGGGFIQPQFVFGQFDVIAALRYDSYKLENLNGTIASSGDRLSPKITFGYSVLDGVKVYASYAEGYRAPALTETLVDGLHPAPATFSFIPNPNLRPEVGKNLEAGVNFKFDDIWMKGDRIRAKLNVFQNNVDDYIESVFTDPGAPCGAPIPFACADAFFTYQNVAKARIRGVEFEGAYDARAWFLTIAGSIIRGDNMTLDQPLESIYPAKVVLGGGVRLLNEKLVIGAKVSYFSAQDRLPATSQILASEAYTLVDLTASYKISQDASAFFVIENIGDVQYRQFRFSQNSPGAQFKFGLNARFGS